MRQFVPNPLFAAEMRRDPRVIEKLVKAAEISKRACISLSPHDSGHYSRSFVIREQGGHVTLGNTDIAAHLIEYGSINDPVYAPLRRGVIAAGMRFIPTPK